MKNQVRRSMINPKFQSIQSKLHLLVFFLALFVAPLVCQAAAYMADESFGTRGEVFTGISNIVDVATAVAIQPDGKIIAGGNSTQSPVISIFQSNFTLVRYNTDGTLDNSFGSGGKVITVFLNGSAPIGGTLCGLILQADGKIIAVGTSGGNIKLVRYNTDGSIDTAFGANGIVTTRFEDITQAFTQAAALQPTGKIVVTGSAQINTGYYFLTVRYNTDGTLDSTFGSNGKVLTELGVNGSNANAIAIQSDAKIVIGGTTQLNSESDSAFAVIRYTADGAIDSSFGNNGIVTTNFSQRSDRIFALAIQPDGKIIGGGVSTVSNATEYYPALVRYNTDGLLDTSFGTNGKIVQLESAYMRVCGIAVQSNGKIVASINNSSAVYRYEGNGTPDRSFGINGRTFGSPFFTNAMAIQPDGNIVIAGEARIAGSSDYRKFAVARYLSGQGRSLAGYDFDGDGKSDVSLFRPSEGAWYLNQSSGGFSGAAFGAPGDKPVAADYDGDGKTDLAVYRGGIWYVLRSQMGFTGFQFGAADDIPMTADFDGDDKLDIAVYRPSNGTWYQFNLANNQSYTATIGAPGDIPVILKYPTAGINKSYVGVYRNGIWGLRSGNLNYFDTVFGTAGDIPVPADYDGDGRTDFAVFRPSTGTWYFRNSSGYSQISFGTAGDIPVPADYDGDGKTDVAVYRGGTWYINRTLDGLTGINFGAPTDIPVMSAFIP